MDQKTFDAAVSTIGQALNERNQLIEANNRAEIELKETHKELEECKNMRETLQREIDNLLKCADRYEHDAKRYRHLRENANWHVVFEYGPNGESEELGFERLDGALDNAINPPCWNKPSI